MEMTKSWLVVKFHLFINPINLAESGTEFRHFNGYRLSPKWGFRFLSISDKRFKESFSVNLACSTSLRMAQRITE